MILKLLNKSIMICAKRNSGKTQLVKYLINQSKHLFNEIFLISTTNLITNDFEGIIDPKFIFNEYNEEWLDGLIKKMADITIKIGPNKDESKYIHIMLILDDWLSESQLRESKIFQKLFTQGRHYKISIIFISQAVRFLNPICRNNLDYLLISQMNSQALDSVSTDFRVGNVSKKDFLNIYNQNCSNYQFLILNLTCVLNNNDLDQLYGVIKAPASSVPRRQAPVS